MYSSAERAAFAALLARARANEAIPEDEIEAVLPSALAAECVALSIQRENVLNDRYDEELWNKWRSDPDTVDYYKNQLRLSKKAYKAAPAKLGKLIAKNMDDGRLWREQLSFLLNQKAVAWRIYNELSDIDKLWTKPSSEENGWPPELVDDAPMSVVLADEEQPTAYALRRVLSRELGVEP